MPVDDSLRSSSAQELALLPRVRPRDAASRLEQVAAQLAVEVDEQAAVGEQVAEQRQRGLGAGLQGRRLGVAVPLGRAGNGARQVGRRQLGGGDVAQGGEDSARHRRRARGGLSEGFSPRVAGARPPRSPLRFHGADGAVVESAAAERIAPMSCGDS
jgi:hypothetical protein